MKKIVATILAALVLASFGSVFAQSNVAEHDVRVAIPEVLMLRFTLGTSNAAVTTNLDIEFDLVGNTAYDAWLADANPAATFETGPTNLADLGWDDLKVFVNRSQPWSVTMLLDNEDVTPDASWDWGKIQVTPTGSGLATNAFGLDDSGVANGVARGWSSLGFGPGDFELTLDGSEVAGAYSATVVYTLAAP